MPRVDLLRLAAMLSLLRYQHAPAVQRSPRKRMKAWKRFQREQEMRKLRARRATP